MFIPLVLIGVGISIGIVFIIRSEKGTSERYDLSPNETRILEYSSTWCSAVGVQSPRIDAVLYLLKESPKVADHSIFTVSQHFETLMNNVQFYEFYLYPGSYIHISMCVPSPNVSIDASFAFITSESNFLKWKRSGYLDSSYLDSSFKIVKYCDNESQPHHFITNITKEEIYYIVFLNNMPETTLLVEAWYQFYRTTFTISRDNILDYCHAISTQDTCYLDTVYHKNEFLVLVMGVSPSLSKDDGVWLETYGISFECHDRYTLYGGMLFGFVTFSLLASALIAAGCAAYLHKPTVKQTVLSSNYGTM